MIRKMIKRINLKSFFLSILKKWRAILWTLSIIIIVGALLYFLTLTPPKGNCYDHNDNGPKCKDNIITFDDGQFQLHLIFESKNAFTADEPINVKAALLSDIKHREINSAKLIFTGARTGKKIIILSDKGFSFETPQENTLHLGREKAFVDFLGTPGANQFLLYGERTIYYDDGGNYGVDLVIEEKCIFNFNCSFSDINSPINPTKETQYSSDNNNTAINIAPLDVTWTMRNEIQQGILNGRIYWLTLVTTFLAILQLITALFPVVKNLRKERSE